LDWGNRIIESSVPCDLLIIDELGPLEFNLSLGWVNALGAVRGARYLLAVVVVRPELLEHAQEVMQPAQTIEINGREQVQERIEQVMPELKRLKRKES
jgi:nucleoside-triphosphatase THEP1